MEVVMRKTMTKASYFDASYQRMNLYEEGPAQGSLRTNKREPGALPKRVLVEGGSMGVAAAYGGHLKPSTVLSHQGIPPTLPVFDGQPSSSLILWLVEIKCYFLTHCIPDSMRYELAVLSLRGLAVCWYDTLNFKRRMEGKRKIESWPELECHMRERFTLSYAKSGNIEGKDCMKSCVDAMVESNECVTKNPCEEMSHVTDNNLNLTDIVPMIDACTIEHLNNIEVESKGTAAQVPILSTYLSPLDIYINKRLQKPLSIDVSQNLTLLDETNCWCPIKTAQKKSSQFICPKFPIFISHIQNCPKFSHDYLKGLKCVLSRPHFHSYMLKRMLISLIQLSAISNIFETPFGKDECHIYQPPWSNVVKYSKAFESLKCFSWIQVMLLNEASLSENPNLVHLKSRIFVQAEITHYKPHCLNLKHLLSCEEFQSLEHTCCTLNELGKGMLLSEMVVPRNSKRKPPVCGTMNQLNHCCPDLISLYFKGSNAPNICRKLLRASSSGSSPGAKGLLARLVMSMLKITHPSSSSLVFDPGILGNASFTKSQQSEIKGAATFQGRPSHGLNCEKPRRVEKGYQSPSKPLKCLGSFITALIWLFAACFIWKVAWQCVVVNFPLSMLNMNYSELETAIYIPPRPFLLVFDPGGPSNSHNSKIQEFFCPCNTEHEWSCDKRDFSFIPQNLRTNSFEQREFDTGVRPKGLSLLMPRKVHEVAAKINT